MLQQLSIKNFALIDNLKVDFNKGFSIITGETGAGKSIILGGLGLVLGNRAELSSLKDKEKKCIIEGEFFIKDYNLTSFFNENELDYEDETIIRREILPSGKSRAFVNDSPVKLSILSSLSEKLIDIHSQHQTLQLSDKNYQFQIIDALADNVKYLASYKRGLSIYNQKKKELSELENSQQQFKEQYDYNLHLLSELTDAKLQIDEQETLENKLEKLNNVEAIKQYFVEAINMISAEEFGVISQTNSIKNSLNKLATLSDDYQEISERFNSLDIELNDILSELEKENDAVSFSPEEIESYNDRLQLIYDLQKKHSAASVEELLKIEEDLAEKVNNVENASEQLEAKKTELFEVTQQLEGVATKISKSRIEVLPNLTANLEKSLADLSMPNTKFKIEINQADDFLKNGKDELQFLFSANKGSNFESLKKVASGGEMSRIMLAVKLLLSKYTSLPTILFDEIDTGVSGEVSTKMAIIMEEMSRNMQVISITHLPQIAAKGSHHYKVYKQDVDNKTVTNIKKLSDKERVNEVAEMISGKKLTDSAIKHAKELLR